MSDDLHKSHGGGAIPYESRRPPALPRTPPRPWRISETLCWMIILACVGFVSVRAAIGQLARAGSDQVPTVQFPGVCKYAVAIKSLEAKAGVAGSAERLLPSLERIARTPGERLRLAIVYGEVQGADAAADRLAALQDPGNDPEFSQDLAEARSIYALRTDHIPVPELPEGPGVPRFRQRLGWFADLALSHGRPDTDPVRQNVLSAAYLAMGVTIGAEVLALAMGAAGLVLLIIAIVLLARKKIRLTFRAMLDSQAPRADGSAYLEGFTLYLVLMVGLSYLLRQLNAPILVAAVVELPLAFGAGLLWPLFRGQSVTQWRASLGLHNGRGIIREVFSGILGYLVGVPLMGIALLVVLILTRVAGYTPTHPIEQELGSRSEIAFTFFLASVWAPVTEELMFRGALFSSLRERFGWWFAAPAMALIFAGVHPQGYVAVPVLAAIAVAFAGIREWRGSIIGSMAAHAMHNTGALVIVLFLMQS